MGFGEMGFGEMGFGEMDGNPSSGLVSRNGFRQISATGGASVPTFLPAIIRFLCSLCELLAAS